jgi:DnaK suppressor protein
MDLEWARLSLDAERTRVQQLLANLGVDRTDDHEAERDASYPAQPLAQQGVDDAVAAGLRDRLGALDRARQRVEDGTYGRSIRSGAPIPDERLEADPAAELTVQEAPPIERWSDNQPGNLKAKAAHVQVRRVHDPPEANDGQRVLVGRLWPRGSAKSGHELRPRRQRLPSKSKRHSARQPCRARGSQSGGPGPRCDATTAGPVYEADVGPLTGH